MFRCNHHHQGAYNLSLLKLRLLKQSINLKCKLNDCFNIVTLASSYNALPDDGDYTEAC
jgi:hypothetical protein